MVKGETIMPKFFGKIGFVITSEKSPGVWEDNTTERNYFGDVIKTYKKTQSSDGVNDNITLSNAISIIADPFTNENLHSIAYVEFMGAKWKITNVEVQRPRLLLTLGDVYNG